MELILKALSRALWVKQVWFRRSSMDLGLGLGLESGAAGGVPVGDDLIIINSTFM